MRNLPWAGHARPHRQRGFSLIELLIVVSIILILITIAVPRFTRAQMYTRETAAIQAVRTIYTAEVQFQSQYGRYAASLTELGPPASGAPSPSAADLIGNDLANGEKQGYKFTVAAIPGGYTVNAVPVTYGTSGSRSFYCDQTMQIHENYGPEPATAQSKELR
ncbi:MAG: prepilin-type N-terminal cleavage/methylation domain-containing protein [Bryobacteraceae bacterium]|jgi:type IV pilus assembly protein PilA